MRKLRHTMQLSTCTRVTVGLTALLGVALLLALPVRADQVTFNDLTDKVTATITSSTSGSKIKIEECGMFSVSLQPGKSVSVEGCLATITGPANSESFEAPLLTLIGGANGNVSDAITVLSNFSDKNSSDKNKLQVIFASDPEIPGKSEMGLACNTFPTGCKVTETGRVQPGITITWSNGAKDTVSFQSDAEAMVPEPSTLTLLGAGLLIVGGYLKKRLT